MANYIINIQAASKVVEAKSNSTKKWTSTPIEREDARRVTNERFRPLADVADHRSDDPLRGAGSPQNQGGRR